MTSEELSHKKKVCTAHQTSVTRLTDQDDTLIGTTPISPNEWLSTKITVLETLNTEIMELTPARRSVRGWNRKGWLVFWEDTKSFTTGSQVLCKISIRVLVKFDTTDSLHLGITVWTVYFLLLLLVHHKIRTPSSQCICNLSWRCVRRYWQYHCSGAGTPSLTWTTGTLNRTDVPFALPSWSQCTISQLRNAGAMGKKSNLLTITIESPR